MSTYTQLLYQIVFATFNRDKTLNKEGRTELFKYIWGVLEKKNCKLYRINCVEDHIHIVISIHPSVAPAMLIKDIKLATNDFIKKEEVFPKFSGWQDGYALFTYHISEKDRLVKYVINQEEHHAKKSFREELVDLLKEHGVQFKDEYLL